MNDQSLSPQIEKALADLRQAIVDTLSQAQTTAPVAGPQMMPPQTVVPMNVTLPESNPMNTTAAAPAMPATPVGQPAMSSMPEMVMPPMPAGEPVAPILPDLSASSSSVTDLSGLPPVSEPSMAANNGLDESLPIAPPTSTPEPAPAVVMPTPEVAPAPEVAPVMPVTPPTPAPAPASAGLPKANSLLSSVLKKGWNSNQ
ncbi:hypothetical protein IJJ08_00365 [bacterium]|nr:hypothetical protein [bacterium]